MATGIAGSATATVGTNFCWLLPTWVFDDNTPTTTTTSTLTIDTDTDDDDTIARNGGGSSSIIRIPLEFVPSLSAYVIHFYLFGEKFGAIIDTGSPFLTVPSTCNKFAYKYIWGCYKPQLTSDSGYSNTVEGFDNNSGIVVWRKAPFSFFDHADIQLVGNNQQQQQQQLKQPPEEEVVFGVFGPALLDGPGGVFFGLIKDTDRKIRPSFLGQTDYQSFCVDLRGRGRSTNENHDRNYGATTGALTTTTQHLEQQQQQQQQLVLSKRPLIDNNDDYIPLVRDLYRRYGAPVNHYHAKASSFVVNGFPLRLSDKMPTYVIFDTGVTGMVVSQELFDGRYLQARKNREKNLWGEVRVSFTTHRGNEIRLFATKPITTPLGSSTPWKRFKGNLIVLGLAFLDGLAMTIDIDDGKLQFSD